MTRRETRAKQKKTRRSDDSNHHIKPKDEEGTGIEEGNEPKERSRNLEENKVKRALGIEEGGRNGREKFFCYRFLILPSARLGGGSPG